MMANVVTYQEKIESVLTNIKKVMIGKEEVAQLSLVALLAEGHVLLEDVPGVGKTMFVRSLAQSLDCDFKRIQFTPDLLPSDITGLSIYNPKQLTFEFRAGPIFGNVILADEINRTSPKTQAALLEGMEEKKVTIDGRTRTLPEPFFIMATQNPIEYEGTYPLPEAQLDRFMLKLAIGYPTFEEEIEMLDRTSGDHPIKNVEAVMTKQELIMIQQEVKHVYLSENVQKYLVKIVTMTREHPEVYLGVSPRGSIAFMQASKAYAYIQGRDYVIPDDVKFLASFVLPHRMILTSAANYKGVTCEQLIDSILQKITIPIYQDLNK